MSVLSLLGCSVGGQEEKKDSNPNIIYVLADDLGLQSRG